MTTRAPATRTRFLTSLRLFWKRYDFEIYLLKRNPITMLGLGIVVMVLLAGILAPVISPYDPLALNPSVRLQGPSLNNWMGTDEYGRDILSRVLWATQVDLLIAFSSVGIAAFLGVFLGSLAGYFRGVLDEAIMRSMDVIQAFPAFILAMGLAVALGAGKSNIVLVVVFIMIPGFARLVRSEMLSARERGYREAAQCMGASDQEIIFVHLLPNCLAPILVRFALSMSLAILDAAGLSFIGLGVIPPEPEWGAMINQGVRFIVSGQWWMSIFPGLAMSVTILGLNLVADGLRDVFDPGLRS